ncbi:CPBP family intramembrane glutamic endopeptidase [Waterburya agarophytonicola]|uniref:CPBP family intramembrane glutamic endopeptidase n=1 Tax=Waterburya agarophytonicola TaxID=2886916 RepID=UPI003F704D6F
MNSYLNKISKLKAPIRLLCFLGVLSILWLPLAIPIYLFLGNNANLTSIITMSLLFFELLFLWRLWGKFVYRESKIFTRYGLEKSHRNSRELFKGLAIGFWFCLSLFMVEALLGWISIIPPSTGLIRIVVEGLLSAFGIGLAEELVFRGWLLDELQRDYSQKTCLWVGAIAFALAHFIKPIEAIIRTAVTFPALILLGITLILAKQNHGDRLGICIGIHSGLVWSYYIVNVGELINYSDRVPLWVTGIDNNPIAGVMGLVFLTGLMCLNRY